ncbi:MAG: hypothetical protein WKF77_20850 [Planctomycetaceae bacterium]
MSNTKPYLFGAVLGASAMYVALQYHVVHSHDGFQMVPRTPQHSVGLAYADVRNWSPSQWTDRPELARALMAHGSSDLISESVANSLADIVTDENSTLDQLRSFLDKSAQEGGTGDEAGLLEIPASTGKPADTDSEADDGLTRIPFPQDARNTVVADPFRVARSPETAAAAVVPNPSRPAAASRFSAADVIDGLRDDVNHPADSFSTPTPRSPAPKTASDATASAKPTPAQQAQATEARIFGSLNSTPQASNPSASSDEDSMFEEVSTQLENRAQAALIRAREAAAGKAASTVAGTQKSSESYVRKRLEGSAPEAVKSVLKESATVNSAKPTGTLLDQFDPFLE